MIDIDELERRLAEGALYMSGKMARHAADLADDREANKLSFADMRVANATARAAQTIERLTEELAEAQAEINRLEAALEDEHYAALERGERPNHKETS
jgi:hypothetical protein